MGINQPTRFPELSHTLYAIIFAVLLQSSNGEDPIGYRCSRKKFTANSAFQSNLANVITSLSQSAQSTGFSQSSIGENKDKVNGLSLCRGDISEQDCLNCLADASTKIREMCSDRRTGVIWYDKCMLKYSGEEFFGKIDVRNHHRRCNWSWEFVQHSIAKRKLFRQLIMEATRSHNLYAYGNRKQGLLKGAGKLYGMVQCTRDLSASDCKKCLGKLNRRYLFVCAMRDGGKIYAGSCLIRYETHPF